MLTFITSLLFAMSMATAPPVNPTDIQIIPVQPTAESVTTQLRIVLPEPGQIVEEPVWVQFRIDGFSLGSASQFERADELVDSKLGQTVHVIIDELPYFPINDPAIDPFDESSYFYNMSYKFRIPYHLGNGMHTIRMFPARSYGESLKGEGTYAESFFFIGSNEMNPGLNLKRPYITYNEPSHSITYDQNKPILLDFYVTNTSLSATGYKVKLSIDGDFTKYLTSWQPYYIVGLKPGNHKIRLELINHENRRVPGVFNDVTETIRVR